ncbi:glycine cleavage system protein GcvH [Nocardia sp. NPDC046763]|uniref:glycine cleavage system protein GcvH n=1 Tax=Nocardia sp. NPDC046763 TaxID=3155256 RepID=UPI0033D711B8
MSSIPADLKYTDDHEWVRTESDGRLTVGITDHAQHVLGHFVLLDLPAVGKRVAAGDAVGMVESVVTATEIYTPASGEVVEINSDAVDAPEEVNSDPYGVWLFRIKLNGGVLADNLLDAAAYKKLVS